MPLSSEYGVVIGTVNLFTINPPDAEWRWPHFQLFVDTPEGVYECLVNVKSRTDDKVEQMDLRDACPACFAPVLSLPDGFHPLSPDPQSGALDVIRHKGLQGQRFRNATDSLLCRIFPRACRAKCETDTASRWWKENSTDVMQLLEFYLSRTYRVYIFGERSSDGALRLRNVHMNQGSPADSPFAAENGIWQDGGILIEYRDPQPHFSVFVTKFENQSLRTDGRGNPL